MDPVGSMITIINQAQTAVFHKDRQRVIVSLLAAQPILDKFNELWQRRVNPEPQIVPVKERVFDLTAASNSDLLSEVAKRMQYVHPIHHIQPIDCANTSTPAPVVAQKHRTYRYAVVGLISGQFRHLKDRFKVWHDVEFVSYESHTSPQRLSGDFDDCFISRHSNHGWWERAKSNLGIAKVHFSHGGLGSLENAIRTVHATNIRMNQLKA